jgi:DNA-binding NarL/FixJ family response regulator
MNRTSVCVCAADSISRAGLTVQLRQHAELSVVDDPSGAAVAIAVADRVDRALLQALRSARQAGCRTLLIVADIDAAGLAAAVEAGALGIMRREEVSSSRLLHAVRAADRGEGTVPPDLLGRLLDHVGRMRRDGDGREARGWTSLSSREIDILRLVADGDGTAEIARKLCYSPRTIKNTLYEVTTRLQLRNRSHAVAYALRAGLI